MNKTDKPDRLFRIIRDKGDLKQQVYRNTLQAFKLFKKTMQELEKEYHEHVKGKTVIPFEYKDRGEFDAQLKFAGDILLFMMHSNIFEFSRYHAVMNTSYMKEDKNRSYCGIINIYNFLADSFKYNRMNDIGYLIGRVFINKEMHYYIEGKKEIGFLYNVFGESVMDKKAARRIIESAIEYTVNFDLLTPPYDSVKEVSVQEFQTTMDYLKMKTGKRLGFKFQADINGS